jgi:dephospho-CoA kinase
MELRAIEVRQLRQEEKARQADVVVRNDGSRDKLRKQAEQLRERISQERDPNGSLQQQEA